MFRSLAQSVSCWLECRGVQVTRQLRLGALLFALPTAAFGQGDLGVAPLPAPMAVKSQRLVRHSRVLLLVRREHDDLLIAHLRVELKHSPYHILELRLDERFANQESLVVLAHEHSASAAVSVDLSRQQVELWITRLGEDVLDSLDIPTGSMDPKVDALRIAEALRAHGLDLGPSNGRISSAPPQAAAADPSTIPDPKPIDGSPPLPLENTAIAPSDPKHQGMGTTQQLYSHAPREKAITAATGPIRPRRVWGGLGLGTRLSPGGLNPTLNAIGHLGYAWNDRWDLTLLGEVAVFDQRVEALEGLADIRIHSLGLAISHSLYTSKWTTILAGFGSAFHAVTLQGAANPGYSGHSEQQVLVSSFAVGSLAFPISDRLRLSWYVLAGATWSELKVQLGDVARAHWGRPLAEASLLLDYLFWSL